MPKGCENAMAPASEMKLEQSELVLRLLGMRSVRCVSRLANRVWSFWLSKIPLGYQDDAGFHLGEPPL
jgi:hypothetical protein